MLYRIYLYKSGVVSFLLEGIDRVLGGQEKWDEERARRLAEFDTESVKQKLEAELTDQATGQCKCRILTQFPPKTYDQTGYLFAVTSYKKAAEVLPRIRAIAEENNLEMYDAELDRHHDPATADIDFIALQLRQQELRLAIEKAVKPVWRVRCLYLDRREKECAYAITMQKDAAVSFEERNERVYACLKDNLADGEKLSCEDHCYTISGKGYSVTYVLEGYKKQPDRIGFVEDGVPKTALLHRMGAELSFHRAESYGEKGLAEIRERMLFREMQRAFPNPSERFEASVRITKQLEKLPFGVRYCGIGWYGDEILFHVLTDEFDPFMSAENISVLAVQEDDAAPLIPFIEEVYPYFLKRYYSENHLPSQVWERMLTGIRTERQRVLEELCMAKEELRTLRDGDGGRTRERYESLRGRLALFDTFLSWSEAQLETYPNGPIFNIQGP